MGKKRAEAVAVSLLLLVGTGTLIYLFPRVFVPLVLSLTLVGVLLLFVIFLRRSNRLSRVLRVQVELAKENHKKASQWDWRLRQQIAGDSSNNLSHGKGVWQEQKLNLSASGAWKDHKYAEELIATGGFSPAFYRKAFGGWFANSHDAASHYLSMSMSKLLPPNGLVDPRDFPEECRLAMAQGDARALIDHLSSTQPDSRFGPAVDASVIVGAWAESDDRTLPPLGSFLASLTNETLLPVGESSPLRSVFASNYISEITALMQQLLVEKKIRSPREVKKWNVQAEEHWKQEMRALEIGDGPLVSVVMPTWNREDHILKAISSVRGQTYANWELIVVDDHSDDATFQIVSRLSEVDPRIRIVRNHRKGVSSARNTGLAESQGDLIAFLDSDNEWRNDYLEFSVRGLVAKGLDWAYAGARALHGSNKADGYRAFVGGKRELQFLNHIDMNVLVARRELVDAIGGFDEQLRRWVDHDFALRLADISEPTLLPFIGCDYEHSMDRKDRITVRESDHWQWVVLGKSLVNWDAVRAKERVPGRLSVIVVTYDDFEMTLTAVESVIERGGVEDLEVVLVDNGSKPDTAMSLCRAVAGRSNVKYVRLPKNYNFAIGCNFGFQESSGEHVLFLNNDTNMRSGSLDDLVCMLDDQSVAGVQPLLVYDDDLIQTAGTVWIAPDSLPVHFLTGLPVEDAVGTEEYRFSAVSAAALCVRAHDFATAEGFDPYYVNGMEDVDLCLRLLETRTGGFRVQQETLITHFESKTPGRGKKLSENRQIFMDRWRGNLPEIDLEAFSRSGFRVAEVGPDGSKAAVVAPKATLVHLEEDIRWGIKNPANAGRKGDTWGDTFFIDSLAQGLRLQGQEVVTYRHEAHNSESPRFDDVSLVLRGLDRVRPIPGQVNVLWIISHPDAVTREELVGFDLVYAASEKWAEEASKAFDVEIKTLLQATDIRRFKLADAQKEPEHDVVFVGGNHKGRVRKAVADTLEAGVSLAVYGPGWEGVIPSEVFHGESVSNEELSSIYQSAKFVLADHWTDMAQAGFIQNRIYDAVAAGCRVISDPVPGLEEEFGEAVFTYETPEDIRRIVGSSYSWSDSVRDSQASQIAKYHSFDSRAKQLIDDVAPLVDAMRLRMRN